VIFVTVHPHPCPPPSRGREYGGNKHSLPLVGGVRGGDELLLIFTLALLVTVQPTAKTQRT